MRDTDYPRRPRQIEEESEEEETDTDDFFDFPSSYSSASVTDSSQEEPMEVDAIIVRNSDEALSPTENENEDRITPPRGGSRQTFFAGGGDQEIPGPSRRIDHEDLINREDEDLAPDSTIPTMPPPNEPKEDDVIVKSDSDDAEVSRSPPENENAGRLTFMPPRSGLRLVPPSVRGRRLLNFERTGYRPGQPPMRLGQPPTRVQVSFTMRDTDYPRRPRQIEEESEEEETDTDDFFDFPSSYSSASVTDSSQEEPMEVDAIIVRNSDEALSPTENENEDRITPPRGGSRQTFFAGGGDQEIPGPSRRIDHEDLINREDEDLAPDSTIPTMPPPNEPKEDDVIVKSDSDDAEVSRSPPENENAGRLTFMPPRSGLRLVPPSVRGRRLLNFERTGYRPGQPPMRLGQPPTRVQGLVPGVPTQSQRNAREVCIRMWLEGFTLNGGPLRLYRSFSGRDLLTLLAHGDVPLELLPRGNTSTRLQLSIEDHRQESHRSVRKRKEPFPGPGCVLGCVTPNLDTSSDEGEPPHKQAAQSSSQEPAADDVRIDETQPTTTVVIRFPGGLRQLIRLNVSHTVADLQRILVIHHPALRNRLFSLVQGFPSMELTELSLTVEMAGVLNSTLLLKFLD